MDRTNWKFGNTHHNILIISIQIGDTAIPLIWSALGKAGNSSTKERIALMKKLLCFFPKDKILGLLADREFIGEEWLIWLQKQDIPFVIRLRENLVARRDDGSSISLQKMFSHLIAGKRSKKQSVILCENLAVNIQAKCTSKGLVIVAFYGEFPENAGEPVGIYRKRWKIECGFACLKRKGFELEDTHLIHAERLETLLGVVAIAFAWALTVGMLAKEPKKKKHGYNANCRFTLGKKTLISAFNDAKYILRLVAYLFSKGGVNGNVV